MEQQIRFCTTSDGVRIAYATVGEGAPLIWVPGWVSHLELMWEYPQFRASIEALAQHFLLVRYDKRGTGLSDRNVSDFSLDGRLRDLEAVVGHLKLRKTALWGVSEGGPVAIAYAARHPGRVSRLILYGTYARGPALGRKETMDALVALVRAEWGLGSATLTSIFAPGASPEEARFLLRIQQEGATRQDAAVMLQANVEVDIPHLLSQVKAPALVIHARGDRVVPFELGREIAGGIPDARLVPLESKSHADGALLLNEQTALQIRKAVLDFLLEKDRADAAGTAAAAAPSGLVTILFTDMEGSTTLTRRLGDAKAQEVLRTHNAILRDALKNCGGSEIKHTGDGIMASFSSARGALECAIAMQRALAEHNESAEESIRVRIGLNAGEPVAEEADLFGTAVQLAARICACTEPDQILAANVVRELAAGKGFLFADLGAQALRGFEDPVRLYEVRWQGED